jgi:4-amino-4-deoxy-L-arabinose transferase-like glycosyltransferase
VTTGTIEAHGTAPGDPSRPGPETGLGAPTGRRFLTPPAPLGPRQRRAHRLLLALILAFGLAKGTYWAVTTQVWNPVDEAQHFGYVESIARGQGIPTVGRDLLSAEVMASQKASTTTHYRSESFQADNTDPNWSSTRHQYEAVHGPTYYALMAPAYWIGRPGGVEGSLLAIRLATVLLAVAAVPFTWLLARQLFPRRPAVWLLASALLVTISGISFGSITNDSLVLTLGTATTVAVLRALDRPSRWWSLGSGLLLGLCLVTKTSALGLVPFLGIAVVAWLVVVRPGWRAAEGEPSEPDRGGAAAMAPWLAWNVWAYHAISAAKAVDALTGSSQPPNPLTWAGIQRHRVGAGYGLWVTQLAVDGEYRIFWERVLELSIVVGLVAAAVRRSWRELTAVAWCAVALPLAFASVEVLIFVFFGGNGGPTGRYFYGIMAPTTILIAAAAVLAIGRYWGAVAITAIITWSLVLETRVIDNIIVRTYLTTVIDGRLAPTVSQTWADQLIPTVPIVADVDCPVEVLELGVQAPAPPTVTVTDAAGTQPARLLSGVGTLPRYQLERPASGRLTITAPAGTALYTAVDDRSPSVHLTGADGDPVIRLYCPVADPEAVGFDDLFPSQHIDLSLSQARAVPRLLVGASGLVVLVTFGWATAASIEAARRRRSSTPDPETETEPEPDPVPSP